MAPKTVGGISGVLGALISPTPRADGPLEPYQPLPNGVAVCLSGTPNTSPTPPHRFVRLGRPPDSGRRTAMPKRKVTLRLPNDLIDEYRDWSWEARCQLGELFEKALVAYI